MMVGVVNMVQVVVSGAQGVMPGSWATSVVGILNVYGACGVVPGKRKFQGARRALWALPGARNRAVPFWRSRGLMRPEEGAGDC